MFFGKKRLVYSKCVSILIILSVVFPLSIPKVGKLSDAGGFSRYRIPEYPSKSTNTRMMMIFQAVDFFIALCSSTIGE